MKLDLSLKLSGNPRGGWYSSVAYAVAPFDGGAAIGPGLIADFGRNRYAVTALSAASIAGASAASIANTIRAAGFADLFAFTRASTATYIDVAGNLAVAPIDAPRFDYSSGARRLLLEGPATNLVPTSGNTGAAVGIIGSGGALPSGWTISAASGIASSVVAIGVKGGVPYVDIRIQGTNNTGGLVSLDPAFTVGANAPAAASADNIAVSLWAELLAGAWPSSGSAGAIGIMELSNLGAYLAGSTGPKISTWQRLSHTRVLNNASTGRTRGYISYPVQPGETVDTTIRLGGWQFEKQERPSSYIPTTAGAVTRVADSCELTANAAALLQRASAGGLLQASGLWGSGGRMIGGQSPSDRLVGLSIPQTALILGYGSSSIGFGNVTTPLPAFGAAFGYSATGKAGSYNGLTAQDSANPIDTNRSRVFLGRGVGGGSQTANGLYDQLTVWPARPTNAALKSKALPYA